MNSKTVVQTFHTPYGVFTKEVMDDYYSNKTNITKDDIAITFRLVKDDSCLCCYNEQDMRGQFEIWKTEGGGKMEKENNATITTPDGKTWHTLVLYREGLQHRYDPLSYFFGNTLVSGITFAFTHELSRDTIFAAYTQDKALPDFTMNKKHTPARLRPQCGLCSNKCDCAFGHNPFPLLPNTQRCCDTCNLERVYPARFEARRKSARQEGKEVVEFKTEFIAFFGVHTTLKLREQTAEERRLYALEEQRERDEAARLLEEIENVSRERDEAAAAAVAELEREAEMEDKKKQKQKTQAAKSPSPKKKSKDNRDTPMKINGLCICGKTGCVRPEYISYTSAAGVKNNNKAQLQDWNKTHRLAAMEATVAVEKEQEEEEAEEFVVQNEPEQGSKKRKGKK